MKSTNFLKTIFLLTAIFGVNQAFSVTYTEAQNEKMNCAIFDNGKLKKSTKCVGSGFVTGSIYEGGAYWDFKPVKGYGKITVDMHYEAKVDKDGNVVTDKNDVVINKKLEYTLNEKSAIIQYRNPKTHQLLNQNQVKSYENGKLNFTPYTCLYQKGKPNFEFCFDYGFYF